MSPFERKVDLILKINCERFKGSPTAEQLEVERRVAINILQTLGVYP